jgi:hypothetical protein
VATKGNCWSSVSRPFCGLKEDVRLLHSRIRLTRC